MQQTVNDLRRQSNSYIGRSDVYPTWRGMYGPTELENFRRTLRTKGGYIGTVELRMIAEYLGQHWVLVTDCVDLATGNYAPIIQVSEGNPLDPSHGLWLYHAEGGAFDPLKRGR